MNQGKGSLEDDRDWLDRTGEFANDRYSQSEGQSTQHSGSTQLSQEYKSAVQAERRGMLITVLGVVLVVVVGGGLFFWQSGPSQGASGNGSGSAGGMLPGADSQNVQVDSHDASMVSSGGSATTGSTAPDFKFKSLKGQTGKLSGFRGDKKVLINFWATWCGPCKVEIPHLNSFHEKHSDEVVVLSVEVDAGSKSELQGFIQSNNMTYPVVLDTDGDVSQTYSVRGIPTTYLIGKDGKIKNKKVGAFHGESQLKQFAGV